MSEAAADHPSVSVVVPVRNGASSLEACLRAVLSQDYPGDRFEVFAVDNGSTDGSPDIAKRLGITTLSEPEPGAGPARNRGIAAARGEIVAFTDSDCKPTRGWLTALIAGLADAEAATGWIEPTNSGNRFSRARAELHRLYLRDCIRLAREQRLDRLDTANAAVRRSFLNRLGGFDPKVDFPLEDREFGSRVVEQGGRIVFVENAIVRHRYETRLLPNVRKRERAGRMWALLPRLVSRETLQRRFPDVVRLLADADALDGQGARRKLAIRFWLHLTAAAVEWRDGARLRHFGEAERLATLRGILDARASVGAPSSR
jgi:glycosyltransferase involved in cell wall biosynthesis